MLLIYISLTSCYLDMQYNSHMNMLSIFHAISIKFLLLLNKEQPTTPHTISWKSSVRDLNKARKGTHSTEELLQTSHSPQKFSWLSVIPFFRLFSIAKRGVLRPQFHKLVLTYPQLPATPQRPLSHKILSIIFLLFLSSSTFNGITSWKSWMLLFFSLHNLSLTTKINFHSCRSEALF